MQIDDYQNEINRSQLAAVYGVRLSTVDNWRRAGLPSAEDGKSVLFCRTEVNQWLIARGTKAGDNLRERRICENIRERNYEDINNDRIVKDLLDSVLT